MVRRRLRVAHLMTLMEEIINTTTTTTAVIITTLAINIVNIKAIILITTSLGEGGSEWLSLTL